MKKVTLTDRFRYALDNAMSRGPASLILWLVLATAVLVVGGSLYVLLAGSDPDKDVPEVLWSVLYQTLTPNPVETKAGSSAFLGMMLFATLGSLFLVSVFIGIVTNAIDLRIQSLRKGRSTVLESRHTLILGWSPQIFTIVSGLAMANEGNRQACVTILADKDKIEMEDEIRAKVPRTGRTRVVCRTGSPLDPTDLEIANPQAARSVIILAPENVDPDTYVMKTLLALTHNPAPRSESYHIVASIHQPENMEIARMVGHDAVELVLVSDMISRVMVQTCRQSGLSIAYTELLSFEGDEVYFKEEPSLVGKTFGEALFAYDECTVIGLNRDGLVVLNPPMATAIAAGDEVIAIAREDKAIRLSGLVDHRIDESAIQAVQSRQPAPERTLILGWNRNAPGIINGLDNYVAPGSQTLVVANAPEVEQQIGRYCADLNNQTVAFKSDNTTSRRALAQLAIPTFQHVIVLSNSDALGAQEADAQVLITLLHLRDIRERSGQDFSIVSEMLDVRNRILAEVTHADDFVVSDQLVSLVLTQVSQNRHLTAVFAELFDPEGSEIYLKPAEDYVCLGRPLTFYTVVEAARRRSEVAIGYRLSRHAHDAAESYGTVLNPRKSDLVTLGDGDKIIVLAEG